MFSPPFGSQWEGATTTSCIFQHILSIKYLTYVHVKQMTQTKNCVICFYYEVSCRRNMPLNRRMDFGVNIIFDATHF